MHGAWNGKWNIRVFRVRHQRKCEWITLLSEFKFLNLYLLLGIFVAPKVQKNAPHAHTQNQRNGQL